MDNASFYITLLTNSIKKRGLLGTLKFIYFELMFDLRYGTDTRSIVEVDDLNIQSAHKKEAYKYQASNYYVLRRLFDALKIDYSQSILVDFGSGKGRVLLVALDYGFQRLVGVDLSDILCRICKKNMDIYRSKNKNSLRTAFEILNLDAADYHIPADTNVFCFYNPFGKGVFEKVLRNIDESVRLHKRRIYIIYINPVFKESLEKIGYTIYVDLQSEAVIFTNSV